MYIQRRSLTRTNSKQFAILIEEMRKFPEFAGGAPLFGNKRMKWNQEWKRIRIKLNENGPPTRTTAEWKGIWSDLKFRTKKKLLANQIKLGSKDNSTYSSKKLTPLEQSFRILLYLSAPLNVNIPVATSTHEIEERTDASQPETDPLEPLQEELLTLGIETEESVLSVPPQSPAHNTTNVPSTPQPISQKRRYGNDSMIERRLQVSKKVKILKNVKRNVAAMERQAAAAERAAAAAEREVAAEKRQVAAAERQIVAAERLTAATERLATATERLAAATERQAVEAERLAAAAEQRTGPRERTKIKNGILSPKNLPIGVLHGEP